MQVKVLIMNYEFVKYIVQNTPFSVMKKKWKSGEPSNVHRAYVVNMMSIT